MNRRRFLALAGMGSLAAAGAFFWGARWRYVVIHHSGGGSGDLELLRRVHRERQPRDPIDEIPYHFVIGNGKGLGLGEVAPTRRWRLGLWGAHVSAANMDRNFRGIGVCLIGDFQTSGVPEQQYQAAVALTHDLMNRYGIPAKNLSFHGRTPGERTLCPGARFPVERFMRDVLAAA